MLWAFDVSHQTVSENLQDQMCKKKTLFYTSRICNYSLVDLSTFQDCVFSCNLIKFCSTFAHSKIVFPVVTWPSFVLPLHIPRLCFQFYLDLVFFFSCILTKFCSTFPHSDIVFTFQYGVLIYCFQLYLYLVMLTFLQSGCRRCILVYWIPDISSDIQNCWMNCIHKSDLFICIFNYTIIFNDCDQ